MNICIVALDFKPRVGGVAEYIHQIAYHLSNAGDNVTVVSKKMDGCEEFDNSCQYRVIRHNFALTEYNKAKNHFKNFKIIKMINENFSSDFLICSAISSGKPFSCLAVSKLLDIPLCVFTYGLEVNRYLHDTSNNFARKLLFHMWKVKNIYPLLHADKVFSVSSFTKEVVKRLGVPNERISILHPGFSEEKVCESSQVEKKRNNPRTESTAFNDIKFQKKPTILTLSRLVERKGIDKALQAIRIVKKEIPDITYIIAGDGPYRSYLESLTEKLSLQNSVIFTGYVSESEKRNLFKKSDLFLMPNRELENGDVEGFGIVFLEANAHGVPVIGGKSGGAVDAIKDGETGLLVNPHDSNEIASAVLKLLENENFAKKLGKRGKERIKKELTWKKIVNSLRNDLRGEFYSN